MPSISIADKEDFAMEETSINNDDDMQDKRSLRFLTASTVFSTHLNMPSTSLLMTIMPNMQALLVIGKNNGELLFFNMARQHTKVEDLFKDAVTAIAVGNLRSHGREIVAVSESGQLHSFEFPKMPGKDMLKPQSLFEQILHPNIRTAYMADINKDGQDEIIVLMTDRVVRTYRYSRGHLETLHKYEISSHIRVFSFGETSEGHIYVLLSPNYERYVLKIDFSTTECIVLSNEDLSSSDMNARFVVSSRPLYSGLSGSMACKLFFLDPERNTEWLWKSPSGDFVAATTLALRTKGVRIVLTLSNDGTLYIYVWYDNELSPKIPPSQPLARTKILSDVARFTALESEDECELLVAVCGVSCKLAIYRINLRDALIESIQKRQQNHDTL